MSPFPLPVPCSLSPAEERHVKSTEGWKQQLWPAGHAPLGTGFAAWSLFASLCTCRHFSMGTNCHGWFSHPSMGSHHKKEKDHLWHHHVPVHMIKQTASEKLPLSLGTECHHQHHKSSQIPFHRPPDSHSLTKYIKLFTWLRKERKAWWLCWGCLQ